jgi:type I restriction enzyme R subunit
VNEAETRAEHIDPQLAVAGWGVVEDSRIRREYPITLGRLEGAGRRAKALSADYVLEYRNTKLGVVEAKAWDVPVAEGVGQAKEYAGKLDVRFTYAANGRAIYGIDMASGREGDLADFPTPQELWDATFAAQNEWRDRFAEIPLEVEGGRTARYYQEIAIQRVLGAVANGQQRSLLTMATGTGKTFVAFEIAWKLFQSRWNLSREPSRRPRILFLADRNILADQAFNAFGAFAEDALVRIVPGDIARKGRVPKNGSIFFTIFQTFMSGPEGTPYFGEYPPDFFDFIVIDECHRGGANDESTWRGILDYFAPAAQLGLTATPKRRDNVDTYAYFGEPVFTYSLKDGINDGFLTPFKVKQVATTLDEYIYAPDDMVVEGEIETGRVYDEDDFNRIIEITERERARVKILMGEIDPSQKTLVFCATQNHAAAVRDLVNQIKASSDPNYCVRVTANDGARGEQFLRDFQDNERTIPTILTTSQKLSTGVDARNVRNIVLMRPVNSMIEFKQIIGRGTRLYEGKDYFTIYDFVKAYKHFSDPEWDGEPIDPPGPKPPKPPGEPPVEPPVDPPIVERAKKAKVVLADGKERNIQSMVATSFWGPDGKPLSAVQFLENLFGTLPEFFKDESQLRAIWSVPETRSTLLDGLADKGFSRTTLDEMQHIIEAEDSDLYDVLAYVAFASQPIAREHRAQYAKGQVHAGTFTEKQEAFLDFVLSQYVREGVDELDESKLAPLLRLMYHDAIADAVTDLGRPEQIRSVFSGFQMYLYADEG